MRQLLAPSEAPSAPPMSTVHVIAACTDRKRLPIPAKRQMRNVTAGSPERLFAAWQRALSVHAAHTTPASDLYCGDHWSIVRALPRGATAQGWDVHLWVASAGYGLIPADAMVASYSATFAQGHADSVTRESADWQTGVRQWWRLQGESQGPSFGAPRSVASLAATSPGPLVVVASDTYVNAMEDDLCGARRALTNPEHLLVVSRTPKRETPLSPNWITTDARMRQVLGGAVGSLHARAARHLLETFDPSGLTASRAKTLMQALLVSAPPLPVYDRAPSSDAEVTAFIRRALRKDPNARHSPLLRAFRASGSQCEQGRFRAIFHHIVGET